MAVPCKESATAKRCKSPCPPVLCCLHRHHQVVLLSGWPGKVMRTVTCSSHSIRVLRSARGWACLWQVQTASHHHKQNSAVPPSASLLKRWSIADDVRGGQHAPAAAHAEAEGEPPKPRDLCVITDQPAHYKDPLTGQPYLDAAAFKSCGSVLQPSSHKRAVARSGAPIQVGPCSCLCNKV